MAEKKELVNNLWHILEIHKFDDRICDAMNNEGACENFTCDKCPFYEENILKTIEGLEEMIDEKHD